jgi:hypothetical protein
MYCKYLLSFCFCILFYDVLWAKDVFIFNKMRFIIFSIMISGLSFFIMISGFISYLIKLYLPQYHEFFLEIFILLYWSYRILPVLIVIDSYHFVYHSCDLYVIDFLFAVRHRSRLVFLQRSSSIYFKKYKHGSLS